VFSSAFGCPVTRAHTIWTSATRSGTSWIDLGQHWTSSGYTAWHGHRHRHRPRLTAVTSSGDDQVSSHHGLPRRRRAPPHDKLETEHTCTRERVFVITASLHNNARQNSKIYKNIREPATVPCSFASPECRHHQHLKIERSMRFLKNRRHIFEAAERPFFKNFCRSDMRDDTIRKSRHSTHSFVTRI